MIRPFLLGAAALIPALACAQDVIPLPLGNTAVPAPTPTPAPFPSPVFTPPVVTPTPTPTLAPTLAPPAPRAEPQARAPQRPTRTTVRQRPAPTPIPRAAPTTAPSPVAGATPAPTPTPSPSPAPIETVVLPPERRAPLWPWLAGGAALLIVGAFLLMRRRREPDEEVWEESPMAAEPEMPVPVPVSVAAAAALVLSFRPTRAGLNLLTATVEGEVTIANTGTTAVADVRAAVALTNLRGADAADLHAIAAEPVTQPATPPFALAPGEERRFRAVAALPHAQIDSIEAAGRPMFVPLVAVTASYRSGDRDGATTQGFAVGVERVDSAKLAPIWLDQAPRSYDSVAARPHGPALTR